jgi:hypothetical protein
MFRYKNKASNKASKQAIKHASVEEVDYRGATAPKNGGKV